MVRQSDLHIKLRLLEGGRLNSDGWFFTAAIPAVISKPKLAFDVQARRHFQGYSMFLSPHLPNDQRGHKMCPLTAAFYEFLPWHAILVPISDCINDTGNLA